MNWWAIAVTMVLCMGLSAASEPSATATWLEEAYHRVAFKERAGSAVKPASDVAAKSSGGSQTAGRKLKDIKCPVGRGECELQWAT